MDNGSEPRATIEIAIPDQANGGSTSPPPGRNHLITGVPRPVGRSPPPPTARGYRRALGLNSATSRARQITRCSLRVETNGRVDASPLLSVSAPVAGRVARLLRP